MKINKVVVVINQTRPHAKQTALALKAVLDREKVRQQWVETLPPHRNLYRHVADLRGTKADLAIGAYEMHWRQKQSDMDRIFSAQVPALDRL